jgi:4-amino-4-deoxy-L-arabinose transferase-like glycosyltransferase
MGAPIFAGDPRVWRMAAAVAVPLALLLAAYCLYPRTYYTGTNSVEDFTGVAVAGPEDRVCVPELSIPAGTARLRFRVLSGTPRRPALHLALQIDSQTLHSSLAPVAAGSDRISTAIFAIGELPAHAPATAASVCLTADGLVNWLGTPSSKASDSPIKNGTRRTGRIAVWYLPPSGSRRSYISELWPILSRASLFQPGLVGPWLYLLALVIVLPLLALVAIRCLAMAVSGQTRRLAVWLYAIAAINLACWALITPPFNAPDEVDHFAYTQSLVERGRAPSRNPHSPLARWSSSERLALQGVSFFTDHQVGDSRLPWLARDRAEYRALLASEHQPANDGGGKETAATHGVIYYLALAPAYLLAGSSPFSQLTLMRLTSALIGALVVLFAYLLARELVPRLPWLAVVAALLVAYQPMYGFISGSVNNDVGVNAGAAALALLLIRMLRRGLTLWWGLLTGGLLIVLPIVKGTAYSLYPVAVLAFIVALWRHHRRSDIPGWAGLVLGGGVVLALSVILAGVLFPSTGNAPGVGSSISASASALEHPLDYMAYVWEVFLPRLSFMTGHFATAGIPAFTIFVERGWGAFGWYDVLFPHWVYVVILLGMLIVPLLAVAAARVERAFVRRRAVELGILALIPIAVVAGFEAAFYTPGMRSSILEFGRYTFPAIAPLAVLVVCSLAAVGRRRALMAGVGLLVAMIALSYASQLLTLTSFYA